MEAMSFLMLVLSFFLFDLLVMIAVGLPFLTAMLLVMFGAIWKL